MVNLYRMGQDVIEMKKQFKERYACKRESQFNKKDCDLFEEHIIEAEQHYIDMCLLYGDDPLEEVLLWNC